VFVDKSLREAKLVIQQHQFGSNYKGKGIEIIQ